MIGEVDEFGGGRLWGQLAFLLGLYQARFFSGTLATRSRRPARTSTALPRAPVERDWWRLFFANWGSTHEPTVCGREQRPESRLTSPVGLAGWNDAPNRSGGAGRSVPPA